MRLDDLWRGLDRVVVAVNSEPTRCLRLATKYKSQRIAGKQTTQFRWQRAQELFGVSVDIQSVREAKESLIMLSGQSAVVRFDMVLAVWHRFPGCRSHSAMVYR